jgi:hypothetical protein
MALGAAGFTMWRAIARSKQMETRRALLLPQSAQVAPVLPLRPDRCPHH